MNYPVFIWTEPDTLTEHRAAENVTDCGIDWDDLPDNVFTRPDGSTYTETGDKPWYTDHDRDDVVVCPVCVP